MSDHFTEKRNASVKFTHTPGEVKMTIGDDDLQMFLTPEQALIHASKLAAHALAAQGDTSKHIYINLTGATK